MGTTNEERCLAVVGEAEENDGTVEDFDAFYRTHFRSVVGLVYTLSGSRWAAEELAQEAFFAAHRRWHDIGDYDDPGAWVRRVAANRAVSRFRRRSAEARALARYAAGRRNLPDTIPALADDFWSAVRTLPFRQAQVVALHYLEDRPVADIASVLGLAEGTVKAHLHRARQSLAERLGELEDGS